VTARRGTPHPETVPGEGRGEASSDTTGDDRGRVYRDDATGLWVFRASGLGGCETALIHAARGEYAAPPPEKMQVKFDEGHVAEPVILARMVEDKGVKLAVPGGPVGKMAGVGVSHGQFTVEIPVGKTALIRGHMDGIGLVENGRRFNVGAPKGTGRGVEFVVEAKAFGVSYFDKAAKHATKGILRPTWLNDFPYYAMQASIYMHGTGLPLLFAVARKDDAGLVTEDSEVLYGWLDVAPISLAKIKAKVTRVLRVAESGDEVVCKTVQYPCPFYDLHDDKPDASEGAVDLGDDAELGLELTGYMEAVEESKLWDDRKKERKKALDAILADRGAELVKYGQLLVKRTVSTVEESTRVVKAHNRTTITVTQLEG
jgi:hypothetical protein